MWPVLLIAAGGLLVLAAVVLLLWCHVMAARRRAEVPWPAPLFSASQARLSGLPETAVTGHRIDPDRPLHTDPDH